MFSQTTMSLLQQSFGYSGVQAGNIINEALTKQNKGFQIEYNSVTYKITVLHSSDLPSSVLNQILYEQPFANQYDGWYPTVEQERSEDGNLQIFLTPFKPGTNSRNEEGQPKITAITSAVKDTLHSIFGDKEPDIKETSLDKTFNFSQESLSHIFSSHRNFQTIQLPMQPKEVFSSEEISEMEKNISTRVIANMFEFLNKHRGIKGIWYPEDYKNALEVECNIKMDESFVTNYTNSFFTGYANEEYFDKTSFYTFKLKEGKSPSEALMKFLEGPTVADCGNATMACYYKALLDIIGAPKFDKLFGSKRFRLTITQHSITDPNSPISIFADRTENSNKRIAGEIGRRPLKIGDGCYFVGVTWHGNKHPASFEGGWHANYSGDNERGQQLFIAHGFEKLTEEEIYDTFIESYNEERTPQDIQCIKKANKPELYDEKLNAYLQQFYTIPEYYKMKLDLFIKGFLVDSVRNLNAKEVLYLVKAFNVEEFFIQFTERSMQRALSLLSSKTVL